MTNTKTTILDVAEDLIQRVGVNAMSYKHISDAVGIRKASIHHHFPQKKNMVDALLSRCNSTYGVRYQTIIDDKAIAPDKLRQIADVFADGVTTGKLCLVGMISSDMNTLEPSSCRILEKTLHATVEIFSSAFKQGREEGSLTFKGTDGETAYAFFSLLMGAQIAARVKGGAKVFKTATDIIINGWET